MQKGGPGARLLCAFGGGGSVGFAEAHDAFAMGLVFDEVFDFVFGVVDYFFAFLAVGKFFGFVDCLFYVVVIEQVVGFVFKFV